MTLLYQAVCQHRRVRITYRLPIGIEVQRLVEPYGLVAKAGDWYLVSRGSGKFNLHRAADLTRAVLCEETFDPPAHFDLESYWKQCASQIEAGFRQFSVLVRVSPQALPHLEQAFGRPLRDQIQAAPPDPNGWREVEICFESFEAARNHLLAYGSAVEVLDPPQLRLSLLDFARQIEQVYSG